MTEIKYYDDKLVEAIKALEEFGDFSTTVDASERAGEILLHALQAMPETAKAELGAEAAETGPNYAWGLGVDED
jgi:hypothetical protein